MKRLALFAATTMLAACNGEAVKIASTPAPEAAPAIAATQNAELAAFFDNYDKAQLALSPLGKAYRGIRDEDYGRWGDYTDAGSVAAEKLQQDTARALAEQYDLATLNGQDALSYRLFMRSAENSARLHPFRHDGYIFDQMNGQQSSFPAFLINIHRVADKAEAEAYVSRIGDMGRAMDELTAKSRWRAERGVMPPDWVYPYVLSDIDNLLSAGLNSAVLDDFRTKVGKLDISDDEKAALIANAEAAWAANAVPAYQRLREEMVRQQTMAPTDDGIWRLSDGAEYYAALLKSYTTTDLSADEIHNIGLREVARIHDEMRGIMAKVGFTGSLQEFFEYTRTGPQFFAKSREEYLAKTDAAMKRMEQKLPNWFGTLPADPLQVKAVEAFREKSAGKAFYQSPAPDGSRPGTYYVNLYNLNDMSLNELEALAFHEGLPGHHLQRSIQTGLSGLPPFRRFGGFTAYTEGWGLYSEELAKDMGFYTDPYSDFGRLGMELWRAARLVVDTGIHHKRWSREQAIQYLLTNTPNPEGDATKAIERYIVYPGQATAYMIGKLKIMELREKARKKLGGKFDIRAFHDEVLENGPVPLDILEENVDAWIAAQ